MEFAQLLRKPTAWLPLACSLAVTALFVTAYVRVDLTPKPDEDAYAHLFQILMALQAVIIFVFAVKWIPQAPKPAAMVLTLQIVAALAVCSPVYFLHL